ncbi:NAD(P)/FAD-dependent oxidoreductase [Neobacillus niacini]|uniref:NAD(P)/FAD-dependent oxidoreductase n=1 Tax=Neobacillus niacini TaxID=86668 RepID=UPI0021CB5A79|nr:NAD(P)/FAD-dependent oxidoreductase [Neobacillus niacini]
MNAAYDVIIVGARCAGASLAIYLAKAGFKILLVDRAVFPSDTLSTHTFFNNTTALFRELGVLNKIVETNAPPIRDIKFQFEDTIIEGKMPEVNGEKNCYCIKRTHLDSILVDEARSYPYVTVLESFRVTDILYDHETVTGMKGTDRQGQIHEFRANLVVGGDGRNSTIRGLVGSKEMMRAPAKLGIYYGYFSGFQYDHVRKFEVYRVKDHTAILFPTNHDLCTVVGIFPLENEAMVKRFKYSPEEAMRKLLSEEFPNTGLGSRLSGSTLAAPIKGILGYDNYWYTAMAKGWALVGDAVCFKDPSMAQGIHDAVYGAKILSSILIKNKESETPWEKMAEEYQSALEQEFMVRFYMGCEISKNEWVSEQQDMVNKLIAAHPMAVEKFLGIYNYANEPLDLEKEIMRIMN